MYLPDNHIQAINYYFLSKIHYQVKHIVVVSTSAHEAWYPTPAWILSRDWFCRGVREGVQIEIKGWNVHRHSCCYILPSVVKFSLILSLERHMPQV